MNQLFKGLNVVVDTLWGDSGKGKIVDIGAQYVDMVIRFAGGSNAGHTIRNDKGEFKLHLIPSGIFNPKAINIIDSGVIVNPASLVEEIKTLTKQGVKITNKNLMISTRSHLVMPWHILRDQLSETAAKKKKIGTTGRGIGPTYADKTSRVGLRVKDLLDKDWKGKVVAECKKQNKLLVHIFDTKPLNAQSVLSDLNKYRAVLLPFVGDTFAKIHEYKKLKKNILGEGAQGALLDIALGGYPYVTCSHPTVAGFTLSTGIQGNELTNVIGVTKAYATRVGEGPMPTELLDADGIKLREVGKEYGATTGRPRRCGWFDAPATRYGALVSGTRSLALMKLDILDSFKKIKVCVAYRMNGKRVPMLTDIDNVLFSQAQPIYETLPGWEVDTTKIKSFDKLPLNARRYIKYLEKQLGLPVVIVSTGADRNQTFEK